MFEEFVSLLLEIQANHVDVQWILFDTIHSTMPVFKRNKMILYFFVINVKGFNFVSSKDKLQISTFLTSGVWNMHIAEEEYHMDILL